MTDTASPHFLHTGKFIINTNLITAVERTEAQPARPIPCSDDDIQYVYGGNQPMRDAVPVTLAIALSGDPDRVILEGEAAERVWYYFEQRADKECLPLGMSIAEELERR